MNPNEVKWESSKYRTGAIVKDTFNRTLIVVRPIYHKYESSSNTKRSYESWVQSHKIRDYECVDADGSFAYIADYEVKEVISNSLKEFLERGLKNLSIL